MEFCGSEKLTMSERQNPQDNKTTGGNKRQRILPDSFCINDHVDVLVEILRHLDGPSLCAAACVCRLWSAVARNDSIWEDLCFRQVHPRPSPSLRSVISALGGYRRLYMVGVRPVLARLRARSPRAAASSSSRVPTVLCSGDQVQLSLSLFCVDYYERLCVGAWRGDAAAPSPSPSSLMFLRKPLNVA